MPTDSDIADDPSRGDFQFLDEVRCPRASLDVMAVWNNVQGSYNNEGEQ